MNSNDAPKAITDSSGRTWQRIDGHNDKIVRYRTGGKVTALTAQEIRSLPAGRDVRF